jgi:chemotaxis protein CheX
VKDEPKIDFGRVPFEFSVDDTVGTLKLVGKLGVELAKEFEKRLREKLDAFNGDIILDLSECEELHKSWSRPLMTTETTVKKNQRRIRVAASSPALKAFFQTQGIAAHFPQVDSLEEAIRELAEKKTGKIDVSLINPFLEGTITVLKNQAGTEATSGIPVVREATAPVEGEVSGLIQLSGDSFSGSVIFSFPDETYQEIITRMKGEGHEAITSEKHRVIAELVNLIFGYAKRILNEKGHGIKITSPSVVTGNDPTSFPAVTGPRIAIPFESDAGKFTVEIRAQAI